MCDVASALFAPVVCSIGGEAGLVRAPCLVKLRPMFLRWRLVIFFTRPIVARLPRLMVALMVYAPGLGLSGDILKLDGDNIPPVYLSSNVSTLLPLIDSLAFSLACVDDKP